MLAVACHVHRSVSGCGYFILFWKLDLLRGGVNVGVGHFHLRIGHVLESVLEHCLGSLVLCCL